MNMVPSVIASAFGVRPPVDYSWNGLFAGNLFERPSAAVTVIVDGMENLDIDASASYPLTHGAVSLRTGVESVVTGHAEAGHPSVAGVIADATGAVTTALSVSADADATRAAGYEGAASHLVSRHGGRYVDEATNAAPIVFPDFSVAFLGSSASFDMTSWTVTYDGVEFPAEATAFFQELQTMAVAADSLDAAAAPAVVTFTVTTYAGLAQKHGVDSAVGGAAAKAVKATIAHINAAATNAFGKDALVLAVAMETSAEARTNEGDWFANEEEEGFDIVAHVKQYHTQKRGRRQHQRRDVEARSFMSRGTFELGEGNNNTYDPQSECVGYDCACFKAFAPASTFHGREWITSQKTVPGQKQGCLAEKNAAGAATPCLLNASDSTSVIKCDEVCAHERKYCPCNATDFDKTFLYPMHLEKHICKKCALGYTLSQKGCYLTEVGRTASVQIGFWTGLAGVAALSGSWFALHTMTYPMFASLDVGDGIGLDKIKGN